MKPEAAFVLALAAGNAEGARAAMKEGPDWDQVGDLAASHQVDALCWWMGRNAVAPDGGSPLPELPSRLRERLRMQYLHHLLRNEALVNDLETLHHTLDARGVDALFLKGPWMAFQAYPDSGTRPVGDIDLCVREEHYSEAVAALGDAGWAAAGGLPQTAAEALERSHFRRQLRFSARGRRPVELHFRLVNMGPPAAEERWVWDRAREVQAGRCRLRVPGPEATLLHQLLHANQHAFAVLRLLHDVRWALARDLPEIEVSAFLNQVRELRCRASCYHGLQLAAELAAAAVPDSLLGALRPSPVRRAFFARAWRLPKARRLEALRYRTEIESPRFYLLEMGRARDKARFLTHLTASAGGSRGLFAERRLNQSKGG